MITFFELGQLGRLGNQLFQYAALRALGLENGYETKIPNPKERSWHGQQCLLDNFNIESPYLTENDLKTFRFRYNEPDYMKFDKSFWSVPNYANLSGFFQSTLYFGDHSKQIRKELTPKQDLLDESREQIKKIKTDSKATELVSIHLRRGDNTDSTDSNQVELNNFYGRSGSDEVDKESPYYQYFKNALNVYKDRDVKFLIFTGGKRGSDDNSEDIEWCKRSFKGSEFLFSEGKSTIQDFCLILSCNHNIISHVSSFGWWAAFLNNNKNKIVVAPQKYHPDRLDIDYREGFYPEIWKLV